jgi:hypothetical protein
LRTLTPTIDPDGSGDYSSNQAAYDANYGGENADFVKYGYRVRANFICTGGTADGNLVTTGALTTSATYDVQIDVGSAYRHDGSYPASGGNIARIEQTTDACVVIQDEYFTLKNMAAKLTATTGYPSAFYTNKQGTHFENCVAWTQGTSIETYCFYVVGAGSAESTWENCIGVGDASAYNYGFYEHPTPAGAQRVHNCTFVSQDAAVASRAGSKVIYVNCILWGDVLTANAALNASSEYNAHKSAAVGGATNWVDWSARSKAEVFEDTANGDGRITATVPREGTNLYSDANLPVTDDIVGTARPSSGAFYLGAFVPDTVLFEDRWPGRIEGLGRKKSPYSKYLKSTLKEQLFGPRGNHP